MNVYRTKIHLQPLPLFSLESLSDGLTHGAPYLRWAFLALCLNYNTSDFPPFQGSESAEHYSQLAHEVVVKLASEGTMALEILQALCLLAFSDIKGC